MLEQMGKSFDKQAIKLDGAQKSLVDLLDKYSVQINKECKKSLIGRIKSFVSSNTKLQKGVYVYGEVGRGKTMLLQNFLDSINTNQKAFIHFHKFMDDFHTELNKLNNNSQGQSEEYIKSIAGDISKKYKVLILDELQINNISDAMIVGRLFKCLVDEGTYVFFSSNRPPDDLFKDGLQRERFLPFIEFIKNTLKIFELNNYKDYRMNSLENANDSYFAPINPSNEKKFNELVNSVIGGHPLEEREIRIGANRNLLALNTYGNVAIFTFKELCEIPLGARDYLALCHNFQTLVIKNIPRMSGENHNEALRFITLIDCMYNSKTCLICTAEDSPQNLYTSGKNSFEFQRTSSRLNDMSTDICQ